MLEIIVRVCEYGVEVPIVPTSSSSQWEFSLLVVRVLVYCSCTFLFASRMLMLVCIGCLCWRCARLNRLWLRKIENAIARECLWMTEPGPPRVLPFEYGSAMWRTFSRCCGAFDGWSAVRFA